jgi:hypothetical protein
VTAAPLHQILSRRSPFNVHAPREQIAERIVQLVCILRRSEIENIRLAKAEIDLLESLLSRLYRERARQHCDDTLAIRCADTFVAKFMERLAAKEST